MEVWSKIKKVGKYANKAATSIKNQKRDIQEDGVSGWIKGILKRVRNTVTRKMLKRALTSFWHFLITPIWGWVVFAILIVLGLIVFQGLSNLVNGNGNDSLLDNSQNNGQVTLSQYAAMNQACKVGSGAQSADGSFTPNNGISGDADTKEIMELLNSSTSATWGISVSKAEAWYLASGNVRINQYHLTKSNIGDVSAAIEAQGISPVFFYMYAVNEGPGYAGFINHYKNGEGGTSMTDGVVSATADAKYLKTIGNAAPMSPAIGGGGPDTAGPTAIKILKESQPNTVARVYGAATSAITNEINVRFDHEASHWAGRPLTDMINDIKKMGGDPAKGGAANMGSPATACGQQSQDVSGGMTLQQATAFMKKFISFDVASKGYYQEDAGTSPSGHSNCTIFSGYFINEFTDLKWGHGNGKDIVGNLVSLNHLQSSDTPSVYSVFSVQPGLDPKITGTDLQSGHTGVILGIDKAKGQAILGEAMYSQPFSPDKMNYYVNGVNAAYWPLSDMTKAKGWSFVNVNDHLNKNKLNSAMGG